MVVARTGHAAFVRNENVSEKITTDAYIARETSRYAMPVSALRGNDSFALVFSLCRFARSSVGTNKTRARAIDAAISVTAGASMSPDAMSSAVATENKTTLRVLYREGNVPKVDWPVQRGSLPGSVIKAESPAHAKLRRSSRGSGSAVGNQYA